MWNLLDSMERTDLQTIGIEEGKEEQDKVLKMYLTK